MLWRRLDQSVERHRARELPCPLGHPLRFEVVVQAEALPELVANMHRAGLAMALGCDQLGIDGDVFAAIELRLGRSLWVCVAFATFGSCLLEHALSFGIARLEKILLAGDGVLKLAGASRPLLARSRPQVSKRTDCLLARPSRRAH